MITLELTKVTSIRKPYDPTVIDPQPVGDLVEAEFRLVRDEKGNCVYKKVGERNIDEYIGSFKNGCALSSILERINLMPVHDKVRYLQQTENGVGADLSTMPTDGTEAFIMLKKLGAQYPQIFERVSKGETLDAVLSDIFKAKTETPEPTPEPTPKGDDE